MICTPKHVGALGILVAPILLAIAAPVFAQAPTDAQRNAIRSACRSDYMAHCSSVPPGGAESLQCLQKNMSSLSSSCQTAVRAVEPAAPPKAEAAPKAEPPKAEAAPKAETPKAEAAPKPETAPKAASAPVKQTAEPAKSGTETASPKAAPATAAKQPSSAQVSAVKTACRSDYMKVCASVPPGGAAAIECLDKNKAKVSASCAQAVNAIAGGGAAKPATGEASAVAPPVDKPAPVLVLRPMLPREELFIVRTACGEDVRALCQGVMVGGGRIVRCLASQAASLSPTCRGALGQFAAQ